MRLKTSHLTRISLLLAVFFGLDKGVAIFRQVVIARQFGLSPELDAFNVANNLPDLLYAIISGGALAMVLIPVLTEVLTVEGRKQSWILFSKIANLIFLATLVLSVLTAIFAGTLVRMKVGIAPGFGPAQQGLVTNLMRLNLIATLIFSISGLVMASLQANQHFFFPAMAPVLYNIGQIIGALILAPTKPYMFGPIKFPAMGLGIHGLVYGVILGAMLHLGIQIPGLIRYKFQWNPGLLFKSGFLRTYLPILRKKGVIPFLTGLFLQLNIEIGPGLTRFVMQRSTRFRTYIETKYDWICSLPLVEDNVAKVLRLMGPRMITVFLVQLIFIARDNLASRLQAGAVSALTYGWMIQQVPETLIGTAIGTAILPTLSEHIAVQNRHEFQATIDRAIRVLLALTIPAAVILALGLRPLLQLVFGFDAAGTTLLLNVTRGFLFGLIGHSLLEVASRSFYSMQNAILPMAAAFLNIVLYVLIGSQFYRWLGAAGISLTDSIVYSIQAVLLLVLLSRLKSVHLTVGSMFVRTILAGIAAGVVVIGIQTVGFRYQPAMVAIAAMMGGGLACLPFIWPEIRTLVRL